MKKLLLLLALLSSPACAQNTFPSGNPGDMIVKGNVGAWALIPGGTAGCVLTSNGPTAAATWQCGLANGFTLPPMATNRVWGNVSGGTAVPSQITAGQFIDTIDYDVQHPAPNGSILVKGNDGQWHMLPPVATSGWILANRGTGQPPAWASIGTIACSDCLISTNNLSDLTDVATARTHLGLGIFATSTDAANLTGTLAAARLPSAGTNYFVRPDGNDNNTCTVNSAGGACLTILKAIQRAEQDFRTGCSDIIVSVAAGTYQTTTTPNALVTSGYAFGCNTLTLVGDTTTPSNVVLSSTANAAFTATNGAFVTLSGFKFTTTTGANLAGLEAAFGAQVQLINFEFGATTGSQIQVDGTGANLKVFASGVAKISGSASDFAHVTMGGNLVVTGGPIVCTNAPVYTNFFIGMSENATSKWDGVTFDAGCAAVTTPSLRYFIHTGAMVNIGGTGNLTYFPGSTGGLTSEGGIYDKYTSTTSPAGAGTLQLLAQTFATLVACSSTLEGSMASVTDSSTATWGATITGSSTNHVLAYCNGTNWTVAGK